MYNYCKHYFAEVAHDSLEHSARPVKVHVTGALALCGVLGIIPVLAGCSSGAEGSGTAPAVRVSGDRLVDGSGSPLVLRGVTRQDTETACLQGRVFNDPAGPDSVATLTSWGVNAIRLLLNEDCWLGINGIPPSSSGAAYRSAIESYVGSLHAAGLVVVLALGWSSAGSEESDNARAQFMADASHADAFWSSVAAAFSSDHSVLFDVFSEPFDISWTCWEDGCETAAGWQAAGMQQLVDAVRSAGADQPILLSGLDEGNDLSEWLVHEPHDPDGQLVAAFHLFDIYPCTTGSCWDSSVAPVAARVPVIASEVGSDSCSTAVPQAFYAWARAHEVSFFGAYWDAGQCAQGSSMLITSTSGTPSPLGTALRSALS